MFPVTSELTAEIGIWIAAPICEAVSVPTITIRLASRGRSTQPQRRRRPPINGQLAAISQASGVSASAQSSRFRGAPPSCSTRATVSTRGAASCQASVTLR